MIENLFVKSDVAKSLFDLHFNERCFGYYLKDTIGKDGAYVVTSMAQLRNSELVNGAFNAPTYQQVVDWFRKKHKIHIEIYSDDSTGDLRYHYALCLPRIKTYEVNKTRYNYLHVDYYSALNEAIWQALKLI